MLVNPDKLIPSGASLPEACCPGPRAIAMRCRRKRAAPVAHNAIAWARGARRAPDSRVAALIRRDARVTLLPAQAQFKPTKPIEPLVHTRPGSAADVLARFISAAVDKEKLAPVRMTVNNKSGGGRLTGMNYLIEKRERRTRSPSLPAHGWSTRSRRARPRSA